MTSAELAGLGFADGIDIARHLFADRSVREAVLAELDLGAVGHVLRGVLERMAELEKRDGAGVELLVGALVAHLRSWRPESVAALGVLTPTEAVPTSAPTSDDVRNPDEWRGCGVQRTGGR
jgi:hypothetical protein